jgi:hypothetical protein
VTEYRASFDASAPQQLGGRRALRLLDREAWEERARADMRRLRSEDLSAEADAWEHDADGNIRITLMPMCALGRLVTRVCAMTFAVVARLSYQTLLARMSAGQ